MTVQELEQIIERNELPDISRRFEMRALLGKYPYFQPLIFIYLKCLFVAGDKLFNQELRRLSVFVADKRALFYYVLEGEYNSFFKTGGGLKDIGKSRTDILIKAFFGETDEGEISRELDAIIQSNVPATGLPVIAPETAPAKHDLPPSSTSAILERIDEIPDRFPIQPDTRHEADESDMQDSRETSDDDLSYTEILANIYIKRRKYEQACEIIKRLYLKYPKKNIYFASQISFLEKLISINAKNKQ
ncbi:MAG: hypothetical protein LBR34_11965 [Prevotella sp.]|jgi:hypothetical protein|nr:hypothetical protein [Prevotella sp.]